MKIALSLLALAAVALVIEATPSHACGDKYLVQGRAQRFARIYQPEKPASILIYENASSKGIASVTKKNSQKALRQVGHSVYLCKSKSECELAVSTSQYDVILADIADIPELEKMVRDRTPRPLVLPVAYRATRGELAQLRSEHGRVYNAPQRSNRLLLTINKTLLGR